MRPEDGFRDLARQVPVSEGRLMAELAQAVERTSRRVEYQAGRGFFGRLADRALDKARRADLQTRRDLVDHVRTLSGGLEAMRQRHALVDLDVARVAGHLRALQQRVAVQAEDIAVLADMAAGLGLIVARCEQRLVAHEDMLAVVGEVVADHEQRIRILEEHRVVGDARLAADDAFELAVDRWLDGETYGGLPWIVQATLLAREVFSGAPGAFEAMVRPVAGQPSPFRYRDKLVRQLRRHGPPVTGPQLFVATLEEAVAVMDDDQRRMVAEILGVGLDADLAGRGGPAEMALAGTLHLTTEPDERRWQHVSPAREAFTAAVGAAWMPSETDGRALVRRIVDEQAAGAFRGRRALDRGA